MAVGTAHDVFQTGENVLQYKSGEVNKKLLSTPI